MKRMLVVLLSGKRMLIRREGSLVYRVWNDLRSAFPNNVPSEYPRFDYYYDKVKSKYTRSKYPSDLWTLFFLDLMRQFNIDDHSAASLHKTLLGRVDSSAPFVMESSARAILTWISQIKSQKSREPFSSPWQAALTGLLVQNAKAKDEVIPDLFEAGLTWKAQPSSLSIEEPLDIDFFSNMNFFRAESGPRDMGLRSMESHLRDLRKALLARQREFGSTIDLLFMAKDPRYTFIAREAGWNSLLSIGGSRKYFLNEEDFKSRIQSFNAFETEPSLQGNRVGRRLVGKQDVIWNLEDAKLWRPPDLR